MDTHQHDDSMLGEPEFTAAPARGTSSAPHDHRETTGTVTCSECGGAFPERDVLKYQESRICASCKPVFFQKLKEGARLPAAMTYGGFWIRFGAKLIDGIVLGVVNFALSFVIGLAAAPGYAASGPQNVASAGSVAVVVATTVLQIALAVAYATFFIGRYAATPGKMVCGLKVVTADGGRVSYGRALGRYFAEILSSLILSIGYIMAAFDGEKRTLHDRVCNTRVIRK
jgi:uncharacterized RDD family membrane protein YckC